MTFFNGNEAQYGFSATMAYPHLNQFNTGKRMTSQSGRKTELFSQYLRGDTTLVTPDLKQVLLFENGKHATHATPITRVGYTVRWKFGSYDADNVYVGDAYVTSSFNVPGKEFVRAGDLFDALGQLITLLCCKVNTTGDGYDQPVTATAPALEGSLLHAIQYESLVNPGN